MAEQEHQNLSRPGGESSLVKNTADQAKQRKEHLPVGMQDNQMINIDLAGQNVSKARQKEIKKAIVKKSNGIIKIENIEFKK